MIVGIAQLVGVGRQVQGPVLAVALHCLHIRAQLDGEPFGGGRPAGEQLQDGVLLDAEVHDDGVGGGLQLAGPLRVLEEEAVQLQDRTVRSADLRAALVALQLPALFLFHGVAFHRVSSILKKAVYLQKCLSA